MTRLRSAGHIHHRPVLSVILPSAMSTPTLESLEPRKLRSISIKGPDAILIGTDAADVITISVARDRPTYYRVSVNGEVARIRVNAILRFRIAALGGNDFVGVDPTYGAVGD